MKNLFEAATVAEVKGRIAHLKPDSERVWGTMNPAQALAHCSAAMEMAMGAKNPPRIFIGRLLGRFAKKSMIANEKPMPRNVGTDKSLVVSDERDFVVERQRLSEFIGPLCSGWAGSMHKASPLLFRAADSGRMGGVDVSASGPSSPAVSGLMLADSCCGLNC